jgi:hypothetical protein
MYIIGAMGRSFAVTYTKKLTAASGYPDAAATVAIGRYACWHRHA